ncbi:MAG: type II toxin-antitoxin system PemK/MazF family toxin [Micromonosporaceae bacterium]
MSDAPPIRGGVYSYLGVRRGEFVVVSLDALNRAGTVIVCEISEQAPDDVRRLLAVQLEERDPLAGNWVLCWRLNYAAAARFDVPGHGVVSDETMRRIVSSVQSVIDPL